MSLMYLIARVPNDGAHRLAWEIGTRPIPGNAIRELELLIGINAVDRLLGGSLTPSRSEGAKIERWSDGAVRANDFYQPTALRWGDKPSERKPSGWRMPMPGRTAQRDASRFRRPLPSEPLPRLA
ncbi:hypothetical protein HZY97_20305 [Sphingomonas sp. R-74633]|uniref:hypothetical protein n=1 Tax=Sphingomonas sp. R-74633 TaxID=2751188 RepID=UPI0015D2CEAE|nr:hypothetical protein [Sphingomonas sp. R-74633]NYT43129.1 hypothetical protein [Sphingomonas sp. R-74633]